MYSEHDDKIQCSCHFPAPGSNCVTHRQALAATAAKIVYRTIAVFNIMFSDGYCVCVDKAR
jgi:hypothetical protein